MKIENNEVKRLFFGAEVIAPWPDKLPAGRLIKANNRHMTLVFLGNIPYESISSSLDQFPLPDFKVGQVGYFDKLLFLPQNHPRVVAWNMQWLNHSLDLSSYLKKIHDWLSSKKIEVKVWQEFLPHVTIARAPFNPKEWKEQFIKLPFKITNLHLYESKGNLTYQTLQKYPLKIPFEELEHTADIAYQIYGETLQEIYYNAFIALTFEFPGLWDYFTEMDQIAHLDDIIIHLNEMVRQADMVIGCPFKAISLHGEIQKEEHYLTWEMIIDV